MASANGSLKAQLLHDQSHVKDLRLLKLPLADEQIGKRAARELKQQKAILGVFRRRLHGHVQCDHSR